MTMKRTQRETLMQPIQINGVRVKNRIMMAAMDTNFSNMDGTLSRKHFAYLAERARGGVGLITLEATSVSYPLGKLSERQLNMHDAVVTPDLTDLTQTVHSYGAKIIAQLHHAGFCADPAYNHGTQPVAPSDFAGAREMTKDEIHGVIQDFIHAADVAAAAGFDGVEVHAAHMYLINQFLCKACNQRTDEYGGSLENRFRILGEILTGIKKNHPHQFILSVRLGAIDYVPEGTTVEEGVVYAKMCEECGADLINVSCGFYSAGEQSVASQWEPEGGDRVKISEAVKKAVQIPVAVVGKLRTPAYCAQLIEEGKTDLVTIGRQLICDPAFPNKIFFGKEEEIRPCLNCSEGCLGQIFFLHGSCRCSINPYVGYEDLYRESAVPAAGMQKKVLVVGGGIAGMQCAIVLKKRGMDVSIYEKAEKLGGQMNLASVPPHKEDVARAQAWFVGEVERLAIPVYLGQEVDAAVIARENPDVVVAATGAVPAQPPIQGVENALDAWGVLDGSIAVEPGKKVAVIGGGVVGSELAHLLAERGCDVTVLEMLPELCKGHEFTHKMKLDGYLKAHARVELNAQVTEIRPDAVAFVNGQGEAQELPVDSTILSVGHQSAGGELYQQIVGMGIPCYQVGDAVKAANFRAATRGALDLAYHI